jgi:hypothetical protein
MVIRTVDFPSDVDQVIRLFCPDMVVLVLLPMLIDYFNGCARARNLDIAALIKIMREPSLVFTGLWFGLIRLPSKKYKIMSWKKKEFEDLEDLLVSLRLYFVIAGDSLCIFTMYYLLLINIRGIDHKKKHLIIAGRSN